jgi:hypothetical protein
MQMSVAQLIAAALGESVRSKAKSAELQGAL